MGRQLYQQKLTRSALVLISIYGLMPCAFATEEIGLPKMINIATPLENKVSYNEFEQLSSNEHGLIFNNDPADNPNLHGNNVKLIIAEVTGNEPSELQGVIGIKGNKANLVIANKNGITWSDGTIDNIKSLSLIAGRFERSLVKDKETKQVSPMALDKHTQFKFVAVPGSSIIINNNKNRQVSLPKINLFSDQIEIKDKANIYATSHTYLSSAGSAYLSIGEGNLRSSGAYQTTSIPQRAGLFQLSADSKLKGKNQQYISRQYQCRDSFLCPKNKMDIKGNIEAINFSINGESELAITGKIILGDNQLALTSTQN